MIFSRGVLGPGGTPSAVTEGLGMITTSSAVIRHRKVGRAVGGVPARGARIVLPIMWSLPCPIQCAADSRHFRPLWRRHLRASQSRVETLIDAVTTNVSLALCDRYALLCAHPIGDREMPTTRRRTPPHSQPGRLVESILQEARQAGLLVDKTDHVSFRAPRALIEAAKKETGLQSTTELGLVALAILARPDPVAQVLRRSRGALGPSHTLEY